MSNHQNENILDSNKNLETSISNDLSSETNRETIQEEGAATTALPELGSPSEFDIYLDQVNNNIANEQEDNASEQPTKRSKKLKKKKLKNTKKEEINQTEEESSKFSNEAGLSEKLEKKINDNNKKIDKKINKSENKNNRNPYHGESPRFGLHYVDAYDIDVNGIEPLNINKKKYRKTTEMFINTKIYNRFIEYSPSDFEAAQIRDLFIDFNLMYLPHDSGFRIKLFPNDTEKTLRVEVYINKFYKYGEVIEKRKAFAPFWITGFGESVLYASTMRPIEKKYRVNNINTFAYRETTKILNKKISAIYINLSRDKFATEQDFMQAQALKNSYIQHHINRLNMINTIEWECVPSLFIDWRNKKIVIKLYLKIISTIDNTRLGRLMYVDSLNVNLADLLDIKKQQSSSFDDNPRYKKTRKTLIDINTIMYLIALNAMYKNILIFSYNTLYECYKSIAYQVLQKGYDLKQIQHANLSTLKIVDFSRHFVCQKRMFDDRLLHLMNLKSSNEEYYRMKYMYTVQKNPKLLYSDFIVKEFERVSANDLALLLRNEEEQAWRKRLQDLKSIDYSNNSFDKDFYINNYNVFNVSNHEFNNVEEFLIETIKRDKDEISRISSLGMEVLSVDQKQFFTKKELREIQKTSRRINRLESIDRRGSYGS